MSYRIVIKRRAEKELGGLSKKYVRRITDVIDGLADDPRPRGAKKMVGERNRWRIRVAEYRILYSIDDNNKLVTIYRIGQRKDVYRFWN